MSQLPTDYTIELIDRHDGEFQRVYVIRQGLNGPYVLDDDGTIRIFESIFDWLEYIDGAKCYLRIFDPKEPRVGEVAPFAEGVLTPDPISENKVIDTIYMAYIRMGYKVKMTDEQKERLLKNEPKFMIAGDNGDLDAGDLVTLVTRDLNKGIAKKATKTVGNKRKRSQEDIESSIRKVRNLVLKMRGRGGKNE